MGGNVFTDYGILCENVIRGYRSISVVVFPSDSRILYTQNVSFIKPVKPMCNAHYY